MVIALEDLDDEARAARAGVPEARRPDRRRIVSSHGLRLAVYEWGDVNAPPILFVHGGMDFAGTWDLLAPLVADGGWRVVAFDQRGHGDSEHAALYSWDADVRDALAVVDTLSSDPIPVVGHSKGGGLMMQLGEACPHRVSHLINIDGLPGKRRMADVPDRERTRMMRSELQNWLDHRRASATGQRKPGTLDDLADRRARMNPRLSREWLRYLVTIGARKDADGWRWKIDPSMRFGGFGPWRPEWSLLRMPGLGMPFLGILGVHMEQMGWGVTADDVQPYLPPGSEFHDVDTGHFVHIEQPAAVAELVLDFLARR
ncbi:MAG TPA: alpha/beta hydrolase [Acidimicrobiales bacterium]|nr:alpha/beta hydrolase [Acidimicrobiales bacterium]